MKNLGNIYIQITNNKKIGFSELIYLLAFSLYFTFCMLDTTMLNNYINSQLRMFITFISILLILFKILFLDKYSFINIVIISMFIGVVLIISYISGYKDLLYLSFMIIGAKNVSFKKIIKIYLIIVSSITIIAMIAAHLNIIENIVYYRNGKPRYSFGSIYCTDFASHIFYMILAYCYIKGYKLTYLNILIFFLLGLFTNHYCGARLDSICIFLLCIFLTYLKQRNRKDIKNKANRLIGFILMFSVPISAIIAIYFTDIYNPNNNLLYKINALLTDRLKYGKLGIDIYGFSLFGKQIMMHGNGGTTKDISNYFFIDSSYVSIVLRYGVIMLLIFCIYFVLLNRKLLKNNNVLIPIIIAFVAINSIVAHHFTDLAYNVFILCFFSKLEFNSLGYEIKSKI